MDTAEIIMYPIKQRLFRYFLIHETGSVDEIKKSIARCSERKTVPSYKNFREQLRS